MILNFLDFNSITRIHCITRTWYSASTSLGEGLKGRMAMKNVGMERGSQNRDSYFHTQCSLARPVENMLWSEAAFGEKLSADSELLLLMKESVIKL
jgi:hypothetical protein